MVGGDVGALDGEPEGYGGDAIKSVLQRGGAICVHAVPHGVQCGRGSVVAHAVPGCVSSSAPAVRYGHSSRQLSSRDPSWGLSAASAGPSQLDHQLLKNEKGMWKSNTNWVWVLYSDCGKEESSLNAYIRFFHL